MTTATVSPTPDKTNVPQDAVIVTTPDGTFRMFSRRNLRTAIADALNEAKRIIPCK